MGKTNWEEVEDLKSGIKLIWSLFVIGFSIFICDTITDMIFPGVDLKLYSQYIE